MKKFLSMTVALTLLAILFAGIAFSSLWYLGWPRWVCCLVAAVVGAFLQVAGKTHYARLRESRKRKHFAETHEKIWFLVKLGKFYLVAGLSIVAAYLLTSPCGGVVLVVVGFVLSISLIGWLSPNDSHVRGRRVLTFEKASSLARKKLPEGDTGLCFGGLFLPSEAALLHFCVVGCTGSGKTLTLRLLMQSVLPSIGAGLNRRALVYDAKRDMLSLLHGAGVRCPIKILNPLDARSVAWDLASDCDSPATALQIASLFIPKEPDSHPFFPNAARSMLAAVLTSLLTTHPRVWTLRDVLIAMRTEARIRQIASRIPQTADLFDSFKDGRTAANVLSELATKLNPFEPIAACWHRTTEKISLSDWMERELILVLGNDESVRTSLDVINAVLFKRVTEMILSQRDSKHRRTYLFLDEIREAGKLDGLSRLLTQGRSKGACVTIGFQDIDGMREIYGRSGDELVGQCCNKAILRLESPSTARWAAEVLGEREREEIRETPAIKRDAVLPSEFMALLPPSPENGLAGFFVTPYVGAFGTVIPGQFLKRALARPAKKVSNFIPRPVEHQYLEPWNGDDLKRLGLSLPPDDLKEDEKRRLKIIRPLP